MASKILFPKIFALGFAALLLTGCLMDYAAPEDTEPGDVTVDLRIAGEAPLSKISETQLQCAVVLLTSNKGDTLVDSITSKGSRLSPEGTFLFKSLAQDQALTLRYALSPRREWKIRVRLYDARDSLRQADSVVVKGLKPFDDRRVALTLQARFSLYAARLFLPAEANLVKQGARETRKIFFTRLRLQDGQNVLKDTTAFGSAEAGFLRADTGRLFKSAGARFFKPTNAGEPGVPMIHEYARVEAPTYTLKAYGYLEGDTVGVTPERLLFEGSHAANTAQTLDAEPITLAWKAGATGQLDSQAEDAVGVKIVLGAVKTVETNVQISGAIDF